MDFKNLRCRRIGTYFGVDENKTCEKIERNRYEIGVTFGSESERSTVHIGKSGCSRLLRYRQYKRNNNSDAFVGFYFETESS